MDGAESEEMMVCQFIKEESQCSESINNALCHTGTEPLQHQPSLNDRKSMEDPLLFATTRRTASETNETDTTTTHQSTSMEILPNEPHSNELQVGDHVYQWRKLLGIPWVFQHHGIVMDVIRDEDGRTRLVIADFSNVEHPNKSKRKRHSDSMAQGRQQQQQKEQQEEEKEKKSNNQDDHDIPKQSTGSSSSRRLSLVQEGVLRAYTDTDKWYRVHYNASWWQRQVFRSGTTTKAKADPVGLVLARVHFILQHPELLPDYHIVHANCECVAFWCRTGVWSSLQGSSFLELTTAGQVKSSATLATAAATAQASVTVPSAGLWGWFGYTTTSQVSWLSLHPMAVPGLACYAAVTIGVPAVVYATAHKAWKETSKRLGEAFWQNATDHPDVFAECITHWSDKG